MEKKVNLNLTELMAQGGAVQKDGNIVLNGYLIKGAPSMGTKFNP